MSDQSTSLGTSSATSSLASPDGRTHSYWLAGRWRSPFGPAHARASLSALQAAERGLLTSGTYGPPSTGSSASVSLTSSLVNRFLMLLTGSTLFQETWKEKATPSGRRFWAHIASARHIFASDFSGWATATARDWKDGGSIGSAPVNALLGRQVWLASWATPAAQEAGGTPEQFLARKRALGGKCGVSLTSLALQAKLSGPMPIGSTAETAKLDQLNPAHSRWLMGFPREWDSSGATAMQSCRKQRRPSSER